MCGIIGYTGTKEAQEILIEGLSRLEYRGYDSAGVAIISKDNLTVDKARGQIKELKALLPEKREGSVGIGHTRWATHGAPSGVNAHPHLDEQGEIALVHNGIIENHAELRRSMEAEGVVFQSETDTEVLAHLIRKYYKDSVAEALFLATNELKGSWAVGVVSSLEPEKIFAARKDSPLVVGLGDGENFIASDVTPLLSYTRDVIYLLDGDIAEISAQTVRVVDASGREVSRPAERVTWNVEAAEKAGYAHFMLKEIHEQPRALRDTLSARLSGGKIKLAVEGLDESRFTSIDRVVIVACGTAYHAGYAAKYAIESLARLPVEVEIASEYRYRNAVVRPDDLFIIVSQSGETADTLAALRIAKSHGAKVLAITNVVGSSVAREADAVFYTWAGPEIAVASTKAYLTQLMALYLIALKLAEVRGTISDEDYRTHLLSLERAPTFAQKILENEPQIIEIAKKLYQCHDVFYVGRGADYAAAMEGSLKIKEVSYVHTEALAAGELKHGTIALIDDDTPVVAFVTQKNLRSKTSSNLREIIARGALVYSILNPGDAETAELSNMQIEIPDMPPAFSPILSVIPAQLIAYHCAALKGLDPDKPRNLAKSVTVE